MNKQLPDVSLYVENSLRYARLGSSNIEDGIALVNILFPPGTGGNFLCQLIKHDILEVTAQHPLGVNNEYVQSSLTPIISIFHSHDILRSENIPLIYERLKTMKLIVLDPGTDNVVKLVDQINSVKAFLNKKYEVLPTQDDLVYTNNRPSISKESIQENEFVKQFIKYQQDTNFFNMLVLDYQKLFLEQDYNTVKDLYTYLGKYGDDSQIQLTQESLKQYTYENFNMLNKIGVIPAWSS